MRTCPKCNFKIQNDKAKFCKNCGFCLSSPVVEENKNDTTSVHPSEDGGIILSPTHLPDNSRRRRDSPTKSDESLPLQLDPLDLELMRHDHANFEVRHQESKKTIKKKSMMWYVGTCFKKYATFKGRASRSEYWYFILFNNLIIFSLIILAFLIDHDVVSPILCVAALFYMLVVCLPGLAVSVRRLHDIGKSGAYYFISFVPYLGAFILLYYFCKAGNPSANMYGERP